MKKAASQRGFVALTSAVIIAAIMIPIAVGAGMSGIFARFDALGAYDKAQARELARSCVETALLALATSTDPASYSASDQIVAVDGEHRCTIAAVAHAGADVTISAYASAGSSYASVSAAVALFPQITVVSWSDAP